MLFYCPVSFSSDTSEDFLSGKDLSDFDEGERFRATVDVDSTYFGDSRLDTVVSFFSESAKFTADSAKHRCQSAGSSRFALSLKNSGVQRVKVRVNGCYPEKINLGLFPNIKVLEARVKGIEQPFHINMYFVGTKYTHSTTFFCNYQVKAVTVLLNIARCNATALLKQHGEEKEYGQMCDLYPFEAQTPGTQEPLMKIGKWSLSLFNARTFAQEFDKALRATALWEDEDFIDEVNAFSGCDEHGLTLDLDEVTQMLIFLKSLSNGVFFCASCAGFKSDFHNLDGMSKIMYNYGSTQSEFESLKDEALRTFYEILLGDATRLKDLGGTSLHFDLGLTLSPLKASDKSYILKGKKAQEKAKEWLKLDKDRDGNVVASSNQEENPFLFPASQVQLSEEDVNFLNLGNALRASEHDMFEFGADIQDEGADEEDNNDAAAATTEDEGQGDALDDYEVAFVDGEGDDEEDAEILYDPENAPTSVISLYDILDTNGEMGSVQSSKVALKADLTEDVRQDVMISTFDSARILCGLCLYSPKHKLNGLHNCRRKSKINHL